MDMKCLVRYSSFQYRANKPTFQIRCMAVHVGSGETGRSNSDNIVLRKTRSGTESIVPVPDKVQTRCYYEEMLRSDPLNPLLLRNFGKFLHEVVGDVEKAEECYERAILASPRDGDLLSLYGKLLWETKREKERAERYMETSVQASPQDCYVAGAYAHFLWDVEEEEEQEENPIASSQPFIEPPEYLTNG